MSTSQRIILACLGTAVLLVFACLGVYLLTYLTGELPSQAGTQLQQPSEATQSPLATPTSHRSPTATEVRQRPTALATATPPRVTATSLIAKIEYADGYNWHSATDADKAQLCKWLAANEQRAMGSSPGWTYYYEGLTAFYDTDEPLVLQQKISEIAALL